MTIFLRSEATEKRAWIKGKRRVFSKGWETSVSEHHWEGSAERKRFKIPKTEKKTEYRVSGKMAGWGALPVTEDRGSRGCESWSGSCRSSCLIAFLFSAIR